MRRQCVPGPFFPPPLREKKNGPGYEASFNYVPIILMIQQIIELACVFVKFSSWLMYVLHVASVQVDRIMHYM